MQYKYILVWNVSLNSQANFWKKTNFPFECDNEGSDVIKRCCHGNSNIPKAFISFVLLLTRNTNPECYYGKVLPLNRCLMSYPFLVSVKLLLYFLDHLVVLSAPSLALSCPSQAAVLKRGCKIIVFFSYHPKDVPIFFWPFWLPLHNMLRQLSDPEL